MPSPDSPTTSPTLLGYIVKSENDAAWRRFLAVYAPIIDEWARLAGLRGADIEEVRSRVLFGLVTALREFRYDPARKFRGYLRAAVNNAVRTYFHQRTTRPGAFGVGGESPHPLDQAAGPDLGAALDDSLTADLRAIERVVERIRTTVQENTWKAYWLTAIEGRPAAEVAAELGTTTAAVYMARSRVGKMLLAEGRKLLGESPTE